MVEARDFQTADFKLFSENADYVWQCILHSNKKIGVSQREFLTALEYCITYLNTRKLDEIKAICIQDGMAEKVSMIIDLRDYVYTSLQDEFDNLIN